MILRMIADWAEEMVEKTTQTMWQARLTGFCFGFACAVWLVVIATRIATKLGW